MDTAIGYAVIFQQTAQEGSWKMERLVARSFDARLTPQLWKEIVRGIQSVMGKGGRKGR